MIILLLLFLWQLLLVPKTESIAVPTSPAQTAPTSIVTEPQLTSPSDVPETKTPIQTQARSVKPLDQPVNSPEPVISEPIEPAEPEPITEPTFPHGTCTTCSYDK